MQQVGELLPVGSIVLLKGGTKKTMIMGVLQTDEEHPETVYDYMGIPYPEGYMGEESVYLFQHEISMISFFEDMKIQRETK